MQLTVREAARALNVSENVVYRLISGHDLPATLVNGQPQVNSAELLEWATLNKREIAPRLFQPNGSDVTRHRLDVALRAGGVLYRLPGRNKEDVLRGVLDVFPLPPELDRGFLLQALLARESLGSTGIGGGIALPHPRYPVVLPLECPSLLLCFLEQPIPYSAADGQPVHTLFALICPTVRAHLGVLARLAFALRDPGFRALIDKQAPAEKIIEAARRLEEALAQAAANDPREIA